MLVEDSNINTKHQKDIKLHIPCRTLKTWFKVSDIDVDIEVERNRH